MRIHDLTTRMTCVVLAISLLSNSTPAAPQTIVRVTNETQVSLLIWLQTSGTLTSLKHFFAGNYFSGPARPETQPDRDARVKRIRISPGQVTAHLGETVRFAAIAYGEHNDTIGGVDFHWSAKDENDGDAAIGSAGAFSTREPGTFKVSVNGAGRTAETVVTVLEGPPPIRERNVTVKQFSTRDADPQTTAQQRNSNARSGRRNVFQKISFNNSASSTAALPPLPQGSDTYGWNLNNYMTADDPGSQVGDPPGTAVDGGAGNGNFQITAPILSLPGRGINVSLALSYNAHLWHKAGNNITYDIDRGWPAPGWALGFGKMADIGDGGAIVVEADGTRHGFNGTATGPAQNSSFSGRTNDGSFIDYTCVRQSGVITFGSATFSNGTQILYGAAGDGAVYPVFITDPNGNFLNITYRNNAGPQIDTVTDTLGRAITFSYDTNNLLTAITAPGLVANTTRTLVRLHYTQKTISPGFTVTTLVRSPSTRWMLDAIFYPATNTGYWFGETDSYLANYGMIAKVIEQRNMIFSSSGLTDMGSVTPGTMTTQREFAWSTSSTTDAPTYSTLTESWANMTTSAAVTTYVINEGASPRTSTVTLPNGVKTVQYSHNAPGQYNDGLVFKDETYDTDGTTLLSKSEVTWQPGDYSSPRPQYMTATVRQGVGNLVTTGTEFTYTTAPSFNQATEVRNYDYGYVFGGSNTLLRKTVTEYENSTNYTNRHIFNLPKKVSVYSGSNVKVSQTEYTYDGVTLEDTPSVVHHSDEFNPYAASVTQPGHYITQCTGCPPCSCVAVWIPPTTTNPYKPETDYRGNITQVKKFADAVNLDQTTAVVETRSYDITGNMVESSSSCCEETSLDFTLTNQYAYPEKQTRGSSSNTLLQVSTSAVYNFNTGLVTTANDANGRPTTTEYFDSLRPKILTLPTGAHTHYDYDDVNMTMTESTYLSAHSASDTGLANQTIKYLNGRGQTRLQSALGANSVSDLVETTYDVMGRVSQNSLPYRSGDTKQWTTFAYDSLGHTTRVTAPDGSVTETYYNEVDFDTNDSYAPTKPSVASSAAGERMLVRDAWGRERWGREDATGKLVEVVEPDPAGNGSVATNGLLTTYSYDTLGDLTGITQTPQTRSFKYDSLRRLTAQKLAEASATLNDAGTYVGSGTWSEVFTYDTRSNLTSRTDARGIKTVYDYNITPGDPQTKDPLSRVRTVSWDTSGFGDTGNAVVAANTITYAYRTKTSGPQTIDINQIASITTANVGSESCSFDSEGRVSATTTTLNNRTSYPFVITYAFDELNRVKDTYYPAQYGNGDQIKIVHQDYDVASRISGLTYDSQSFASNMVYNPASQATSMKVGVSGANQIIETYGYGATTGLLTSQQIARSSTPTTYLLDLQYEYTDANSKTTGQLKRILNNLNHNKDRSYTYDAVRRLTQAKGGVSGALWTQTYAYDRYGNRTLVSASGSSAKNERPVGPTRTDLLARNVFEPPALNNDDTKSLSDSPLTLFPADANTGAVDPPAAPFQGGPPTFTDDPLTAGTVIQAIHVTQLRDAINSLRLRSGLTTVSWAESVSAGVGVKASHITEMRTGLEQARTALGMAPTTYTDSSLAAGYTIKKEHIQEIRDSLKAAWTVSSQISRDGHASLSYDANSNRITTSGFAYDAAGNQVQALIPNGSGSQRYQYDAAGRLAKVKTNDGATVLATYTYGHSNVRLLTEEGTSRTYYVSDGSTTLAEFSESGSGTIPNWSKSYVYIGARLLSTLTPNAGGELVEHHHPDRLGTRLVTNPGGGSSENVTLPFGTVITSESPATTNRKFTSYDRAGVAKLDYAVNRYYDSQQGRFTQVDPAAMKAVNLEIPQTLNLYAYCANDPVNQTDPSGLGFLSFLKKVLRIVLMVAVVVALAVITIVAPVVIGGLLGNIVMWTAFVGTVIAAGQLAAEFLGHISQWINRCRVPDFAGLSAGRQEELRQRGVSPEQWNGLANKARLAYFNIVAAITAAGLSLAGWLVDWSSPERGIRQDRVFFIAGPGATNLLDQVSVSRGFSLDLNRGGAHGEYNQSYRDYAFYRSLQLSFVPAGDRLDADLDPFNLNFPGVPFVLHFLSVFSNRISRKIFHGSGLTNPYNVAYRSSWECK